MSAPTRSPAGEREHAGLERVVEREQQVQTFDLLDLTSGELVDIANAQRGRDDCRLSCSLHAVAELQVVGLALVQETRVHLGTHGVADLLAGPLLAAERKPFVSVRAEMRDAHRQLVVILQGVDQARGIHLVLAHELMHEAQELRVPRQERVVIRRAREEIVGKIRPAGRHGAQIVER